MTNSRCKICGAEIQWVIGNSSGVPVPMDYPPIPSTRTDGDFVVIEGRAFSLIGPPIWVAFCDLPKYTCHRDTCPGKVKQ